jgi:hypothetical protein
MAADTASTLAPYAKGSSIVILRNPSLRNGVSVPFLIFRHSPSAFRNSDVRIMVVIGFKPMHNIRQSYCRGNPLWLPKNQGRHGGLPLQGYRIADCEMRIAELIRNNQSALRNFSFFAIRLPPFAISLGVCQKNQGRHIERSNVYYTRPAPTRIFQFRNVFR